jgi:hypothetical protein
MNFLKQNRLIISLLLFLVLFAATWPFYKYIFDVDGIGYASVAHHYINGDWQKAINGFWYPLHSWLVIPFIKMGFNDGAAFKISNLFISLASLAALHKLLIKTELNDYHKISIQLTAVIMLLHYSYTQLAGDILFMFVLLLLINLHQTSDFYTSITKNIAAGLLGVCLYLSKSYGFPFFLVYYICGYIFFNNKKMPVKYIFTGLAVFFLLSFLWMIALHWKYNTWFVDFAKYRAHLGDRSAYTGLLIQPPPYNTSAAVWEDPWLVNIYELPQKDMASWFLQEMRVIIFNIQNLLIKLCDLSFLAPAIIFGLTVSLFVKNNYQRKFWLFTILMMPAGYLLLHVETRFIWVLSFILLIAGASLLHECFSNLAISKKKQLFLWSVFFASFLLKPIDNLKDDFKRHEQFYELAGYIKSNQLSGNFTSNNKPGENMVVAYLSGMRYFKIAGNAHANQLLAKFRELNIRYYFFYYDNTFEKELFMNGLIFKATRNSLEAGKNLIIFEF